MADPWLVLIGLGEDGLAGLPDASRAALADAQVIFGGPRHLALVGAGDRGRPWPVPFDVAPVLAARGQRVVVLASGDPFWFGAGGSLARHLAAGEWVAHPAPSTFGWMAARLGWRLEAVTCLGLHAAPLPRLRPHLAEGARILVLIAGPDAVAPLAGWLQGAGFGRSILHLCQAMGGADERIVTLTATDPLPTGLIAPLALAIEARADHPGAGLPRSPGLADDLFATDGQITKAPMRALTLAALAPRAGERLWDLGAGSGSVSVEWCLAGGRAEAVERDPARQAHIRANAQAFGVDDRLTLHPGDHAALLDSLPAPQAVFVGGGGDAALFDRLLALPPGTRLVANAVTLETQVLVTDLHARRGGRLMRVDLAEAGPLGRMRGWTHARGVVQWAVVL
ncbi:precorrin-6y C5,15-methyltransferase (decarboxylating) subunit CbiE [Paracoccus sp. p3-h83]|uniref:precorrin-6y C5,15-methyltransferase (decarboxylating) subunit CbiE n=1 Tax=Paracoccus sp. p3-h83 TaxID=3342805 RepID=UPI0035B7E6A7